MRMLSCVPCSLASVQVLPLMSSSRQVNCSPNIYLIILTLSAVHSINLYSVMRTNYTVVLIEGCVYWNLYAGHMHQIILSFKIGQQLVS